MADTKSTPISLNDLTVEVVEGVGKSSNKPYKALRFLVNLGDGQYRSQLVTFINEVKK